MSSSYRYTDSMCNTMVRSGSGIASRSACRDCGCKVCTLAWQLTGLHEAREQGAGIKIRFGVVRRHGFCVTLFGTTDHDVYLYVRSEHAFSFLPVRSGISGNTGSPRSWHIARNCLLQCLENHECSNLQQGTRLPRRVLDLQAVCASRISLHESENQPGTYACLSHRWGASQPLKTTTETLSAMKAGILASDLPKTFRDAITIVRYLGIRYVWIDSLCIIQDDDQDWKRESAQMASIYQNSMITIAATASDGADSGLFHDNPKVADKELATFTKNPDHEGIFMASGGRVKNMFHGFEGSPQLLSRGWVMQERLLSPRVLHFHHELVFECRSKRYCECPESDGSQWPRNIASKHNCDELQLANMDPNSLHDSWHHILKHYSTLQLTFDSDVLPAISGLARVYQRYVKGRYIAGMWEAFLLRELAWRNTTPRSSTRRYPWVAPTFSWASLKLSRPSSQDVRDFRPLRADVKSEWGLQWAHSGRQQAKNECEVLDVSYSLIGTDVTGQITDSSLILKGLLYPTIVQGLNRISTTCGPRLASDEDEYFYADFDYTDPQQAHHSIGVDTKLYCFLLQTHEPDRELGISVNQGQTGYPDWACFLVLKKIRDLRGSAGMFERVGLMEYEGRRWRVVMPWSGKILMSRVAEFRAQAAKGSEIVKDAVVWIV